MPAADDDRPAILLVQPERRDRDRYAHALRKVGLLPVAVATASDALPLAAGVDLVVTGLLLPGPLDGVAFVARLRSDPTTRRLPVIALTRCAWERERALQAGCDLFLPKPCPPHALAREVLRLAADAARRLSQQWVLL